MPNAEPHLCNRCRLNITVEPNCASCKPEIYKRRKGVAGIGFYKTKEWQGIRRRKLSKTPFCEGMVSDYAGGMRRCNRLANVVDHKTPISKGGDKRSENNLQSLCQSCHSRKTASENRI